MAKTKTPFLSLGSTGSIGGSITTQKRGSVTLVRTKPIPAYTKTLPQQYQRWLYQDALTRWSALNATERQANASLGSRFHLTGMQYFIKTQLKAMLNISAWYRLDTSPAATAYDNSPNKNHGTVYGASPIAGAIDGARYFDGLNDYVNCGYNAPLRLDNDFTIMAFIKGTDHSFIDILVGNRGIVGNVYGFEMLQQLTTGTLRLLAKNASGILDLHGTTDLASGAQFHVAITRLAGLFTLYINGIPENTGTLVGALTPMGPFCIGDRASATLAYKGIIDNVIYYSVALSQAELQNWVTRRYPP